jgi:hypothetical protein
VAKVVFKSLKAGRFTGLATRSVGKKRVLKAGGGWKTVRTLDANSAVFEEGLRYVFTKNVAKARRDNKRVVGTTDVARSKR